MQALFQYDARTDNRPDAAELSAFRWMDYAVPVEEREYAKVIIEHTLGNLTRIDDIITERLVNWEFERISPVSRAILRTGVAQLLYMADQAEAAVVIDECILLAKQYDAAETTSFVNGLLDDVRLMGQGGHAKPKTPTTKIRIRKPVK